MRHIERVLLYHTADSAEVSESTANADERCVRFNLVKPSHLVKLFANELLNLSRPLLRVAAVVFEEVRKCHGAKRKRLIVDEISSVVVNKVG